MARKENDAGGRQGKQGTGLSRREVLLGAAALAAGGAMRGYGAAGVPAAATQRAGGGDLVVHEWGVAIRHPTSGGTVLASPVEMISALPAFVQLQKSTSELQPIGWDKPVIWFYGSGETKFRLSVRANQGFPTACFPAAEVLTRKYSHSDPKAMMFSILTEFAGYQWEGTLTAEPTGKVPGVAREHWWQKARAAGGLYANVGGSSERFIFYEASALQEPTVTAKVERERITLRNAFEAASGQVLLVVNTGGRHYAPVVESIGAKGEITLGRGEVMKTAVTEEQLLSVCAAQWKSFGMTEAEGEAIAAVWWEDLVRAGRLLLISRMPEKHYEAMFPLVMEPAPRELIRVGLVFDLLDGEVEAAAWVSEFEEMRARLVKAGQDLGADDFAVREEAARVLAEAGERARGVLEQMSRSADAEVSARAEALLKKITPEVTLPVREGTNAAGVRIQAVK